MSMMQDPDAEPPAAVSETDIVALIAAVNALDGNHPDPVLIDQITQLERLKSSCAAVQARLTHAFTVSQSTDGAAEKVDPDVARRSIAGQIALARHDSRYNGSRHLGAAHALVTEMPHTLAALANGDLSERRAHLVIEQFGCLTPADRRRADSLLAPSMPGLGNRTAQSRAAAIAYQLDPEAVMGKVRGAVKDRHVTLRPAPDTMSRLSALLPVAQGVAVWAALLAAANNAKAVGDPRGRGQVMADHLVSELTGARLTGCDPYGAPRYAPGDAPAAGDAPAPGDAPADDDAPAPGDAPAAGDAEHGERTADLATDPEESTGANGYDDTRQPADRSDDATDGGDGAGQPAGSAPEKCDTATVPAARPKSESAGSEYAGLSISLIMTDRTLLGDDDAPAHLRGYGPIPAALARALISGQADHATRTWVRRLYTDPHTGQLAAMDSRQRLFPQNAKDFLLARDQSCRTPCCDAPIRHLDHITPHHRGGPTSVDNGQGLCEACNHTKQAPHWVSTTRSDGIIQTRTPTGHTYDSEPLALPKSPPWTDISTIESRLVEMVFDAA